MKIYLASPFSHKYFWVRWYRVFVATICAAKLMRDRYVVFSPLTHSFFIALFLPKYLMCDHNFWMKQDLPEVDSSDVVVVISKDRSWRDSKGVRAEVKRACEKYRPFFVFSPEQIKDGSYRFCIENSFEYYQNNYMKGFKKEVMPNEGQN